LLNSEHQIGAAKANFFFNFGFSAENWEQLVFRSSRNVLFSELS
jgi:hypothetical protein